MKNKYQQQTDEAMKRFICDNSDFSFQRDGSKELEGFVISEYSPIENQPIPIIKNKGNLNKKTKKRINVKHRRK